MSYLHKNAAAGRWQKMSIEEQLSNIGSEVGRSAKWQVKDEKIFYGAVTRALELFDLTLEDPRWKGGRLMELGRLKEVFCDGVLGGKEYNTDLHDLEKYFYPFMNLVTGGYGSH
ncbi:MAG: hypothetical protein Q8R55_07525 [Candidatus Taylorbacteria bacterium]|nr:hypothetical protein [Candidatus Taylorbacteria bacterium]